MILHIFCQLVCCWFISEITENILKTKKTNYIEKGELYACKAISDVIM